VVGPARKLIIRLGAGTRALSLILAARRTILSLTCGPGG
jgi:hypothetical protein